MLSCFSRVQLCATLWTVGCQAPLSMGLLRKEYWSRFPCPSLGDLPNLGIEPSFLCLLHWLLLLLSCFSHVWLCATQWMAAHQAPPSLGFSRQEHWSGLPFPSPMHENEKWKWSCSVVSNSSRPHGLQPTRLLHPWDFPSKSTEVGCHCLLHETWVIYPKWKWGHWGIFLTFLPFCAPVIPNHVFLPLSFL